ncbi:cobalamin biosynthesis protein CbiG [Oxobacter pfennigii]|uniref:Cobalamin biosynthesis protein CbiG n=1 Tax=Oxobacter pfennigii TaxID=36849 RepID=A0A0P8YDU3_9CLOT|nr:cobalt-precorrin 5A hydrolase [Oxobacter pfennigii]KPU45410.1 cobalamin biosynthesis protein CbiG [Oxobacter pfennigii]
MKIACIVYSNAGEEVALRIKEKIDIDIFKSSEYKSSLRTLIKKVFLEYEALIFICAAGIAVRMIAPYIKDKTKDPAVIVIDDMGKYCISLLSGHIGGANELTQKISSFLNAEAVITTASDNRGIDAVDVFAKRNNFIIESMKDAKVLTSVMVNGGTINFISQINASLNYDKISDRDFEGTLIVTSKENVKLNKPYCILRPKVFNIGIGCRRGKSKEEILGAIEFVFKEHNLSLKSVKTVASIDIKKDEDGIIKAAYELKCPFKTFTEAEIEKVQHMFDKSSFVQEKVGVKSVAEPCAYLSGGKLIVNKTIIDGITIAVAEEV